MKRRLLNPKHTPPSIPNVGRSAVDEPAPPARAGLRCRRFEVFHRFACLGAALLALGFTGVARAVVTETADYDTFAAFNQGDFDNVALGSDGVMELAPGLTNLAKLKDPIIWAAVRDRHGNVYLGTGNQGKVYRLTPRGKLSVLFAPHEVMVHALALDPKGRLYAATSPNGRVYRLDDRGRAEVYCSPGETYIWAMTFDKQGALYLATGDHGKILRVPPRHSVPAKAETYFETDEKHITALAWDRQGNLLAGTSPHGYLYRIDKAKHGFVLFNSNESEIKQIAVAPDGTIYVSTFVEKTPSNAATGGAEAHPPGTPAAAGGSAPANAAARAAAEKAGEAGKSMGAVYRVDTNGFHERYWSAPGEAIYAMLRLRDGHLLVGTGDKGRIYSITSPTRWRLLQTISDGAQVSVLLPEADGSRRYLAATSHPAWLSRLDFALAPKGTYTAKVFDAKQVSRWGNLHPDGSVPTNTVLEFSTRSGNTEKPEKTWSDWSAKVPLTPELGIASPPARYLQYRVSFGRETNTPGATARLRRVRLFYQNENAAPVIPRIKVYAEGFRIAKLPVPQTEAPANLSQLLSGNGPGAKPPKGRVPPLKLYKGPGLCTVVWEATDPNGDDLVYSVAIRAEQDKSWTTLTDKTDDTFFSFDTAGFSEGYYRIRITASDEPDNTPETARTAMATSEPFLIDNTPPALTVLKQQVEKGRAHFVMKAVDGASVIDAAAYSLDGKEDVALRPADLLFDSTHETFKLELTGLSPGAHSLLLHVQDEANNTAVLKLNFESR